MYYPEGILGNALNYYQHSMKTKVRCLFGKIEPTTT